MPYAKSGLLDSTARRRWEAHRKDRLEVEVEMQRLVCHGLIPLAEAQRAIAEDWLAAERRFLPIPAK